jgi:hypothetical protein
MKRDSELYDTKPGAEMPPGDGNGLDEFAAHFGGDFDETIFAQSAQISGAAYCVQ